MFSYRFRLLQGTVLFSGFFLSVCLLIVRYNPAQKTVETSEVLTADTESVSFSSLHANLLTSTETVEVAYSKTDADVYSPVEDRGLNLYRQAQTRPVVEWFYTRWTGSRDIALAILENADRNNISLSLAFSLAYIESHYKPHAINYNSNKTVDRGLFQLNSASFPRLTESEFFNTRTSARYGINHLRHCMDIGGNEKTGLAIYNAGAARVKNNRTPARTVKYVNNIIRYRNNLERNFMSDVVAVVGEGSTGALAMAKQPEIYEF